MKARMALELFLPAAVAPGLSSAVELHSDTLQAWEKYIANADGRMQARLDDRQPFLWSDEAAGRSACLRHGEILVAPVRGRGSRSVVGGLIHDWVGAVFIPNATLEGVLAVVHDYDRYKEFYKPVVADSKVFACTETDQYFSMVWQRKVLFVDAAIESQYRAHGFALDGRRGYSIINTTEVREIEDYGRSQERLLEPGHGNGFIWRLHSIARYEESDGGVYLELEAIALTRDIPASLGWLVHSMVNHLSINSLTTSLRQTRDAVGSLAGQPERPAPCGSSRLTSAKVKAAWSKENFPMQAPLAAPDGCVREPLVSARASHAAVRRSEWVICSSFSIPVGGRWRPASSVIGCPSA
jgi:hypothetical protein